MSLLPLIFILLCWSQGKAKTLSCANIIKLVAISLPSQFHTQDRHQQDISAPFPTELRLGISLFWMAFQASIYFSYFFSYNVLCLSHLLVPDLMLASSLWLSTMILSVISVIKLCMYHQMLDCALPDGIYLDWVLPPQTDAAILEDSICAFPWLLADSIQSRKQAWVSL